MNIFVLDSNPIVAATMMCDKHIPKMVLESAQMMAQALRRHGATDEQMPLTKSGTPYKGGHPHHPCTVWVGDNRENFLWLADHAYKLLCEFYQRFGKEHACTLPIIQMTDMEEMIPEGDLTPFALAMPDEFRPTTWTSKITQEPIMASCGDTAVQAYRRYYHTKTFAKWERGRPAPTWWSA